MIQILFQGKKHTIHFRTNLQDVTFLFRLKNYKMLVMSSLNMFGLIKHHSQKECV